MRGSWTDRPRKGKAPESHSSMGATLTKDIEIRWGDLDALNHVNNTAFLRYLEEARIQWFNSLRGPWESTDYGPVVVNINCNFRREIQYPAVVSVSLDASRPSEKRVVLSNTIFDRDDPATIYADAEVTVVWIDRHTQRSIPVPESVVASVQQPDSGTGTGTADVKSN